MKNKIALTIMALGLTLPAIHLNAQDAPPPRGPRGDRPHPPVPPLVAALDANHDGVIDAKELSAAADSLRALDKNKDGKLTPDELRPARPAGAPAAEDDQAADHPRPPREHAQTTDGQPAPGHRPGPPLVAALDANHDGVIDSSEIANATEALKALDKNGDGQLTMAEIHPRGPRGQAPGPKGVNGDRPHRPHPPQSDTPPQE